MHDRQTIALSDVPVELRLGVPDAERARPQTVLVSVELDLFDPPAFPRADHLSGTIDYDAIIAFLQVGLPARGEIHLIETVADLVAQHTLALSPRIAWVDVTVKKPAVLGGAGLVSVSLRRYADRATHRVAAVLAEEAARHEAKL
ncbi:MAG: dihydroneopterin aldolase [Alphaproteobacteria bacterium]|nr:dihydroneopterin aldolase [Alphaproteobacteria bacterium]